MLDLIVEHQAGIPVLMKPLSGNSSDAHDFGQLITDHMAQLQTTYGMTFLVADSALYSAENLQKLAATRLKWITRVPATLREAQAVLAQVDPQTMAPLMEGYRYRVVPSSYGGVEQRWVLIYSEPRQPQAQRTVDKHLLKHSEQEVKAFKQLCRTAFACEADAQQALVTFAQCSGPQRWPRALSVPPHAMPSGGAQAQIHHRTTSCISSTAHWPCGSQPVKLSSTNTVVLSSPRMNSTTPAYPRRSC
jgi:hypothetical protein